MKPRIEFLAILYSTVFVVCAISLTACINQKSSKINVDAEYNLIPKDTLTELLSFTGHPDSVLSVNQLETKRKINKLLEEYLTVVDNHFVFLAKPEHFEKAGLSKYYYIMYQKSFKDLNHTIDSLGIKDLEEKFKNGSIEKGYTLYSNENIK